MINAPYIEEIIPMVKVTAKPLVAPTPNVYNKKAAINELSEMLLKYEENNNSEN